MASLIVVQNKNKHIGAPARVGTCESFACRWRGLMFRSHLSRDEGLLLKMPHETRLDSSIHMLFVPFDLAVFWISSTMQVVDKVLARAWRPAYFPAGAARYILEIHAGRLGEYEVGDTVEFLHA